MDAFPKFEDDDLPRWLRRVVPAVHQSLDRRLSHSVPQLVASPVAMDALRALAELLNPSASTWKEVGRLIRKDARDACDSDVGLLIAARVERLSAALHEQIRTRLESDRLERLARCRLVLLQREPDSREHLLAITDEFKHSHPYLSLSFDLMVNHAIWLGLPVCLIDRVIRGCRDMGTLPRSQAEFWRAVLSDDLDWAEAEMMALPSPSESPGYLPGAGALDLVYERHGAWRAVQHLSIWLSEPERTPGRAEIVRHLSELGLV